MNARSRVIPKVLTEISSYSGTSRITWSPSWLFFAWNMSRKKAGKTGSKITQPLIFVTYVTQKNPRLLCAQPTSHFCDICHTKHHHHEIVTYATFAFMWHCLYFCDILHILFFILWHFLSKFSVTYYTYYFCDILHISLHGFLSKILWHTTRIISWHVTHMH